ncbi:MAG: BlaI/MecI/CopY family transcriptional regulator [Verrucomicrobiales bacterium]|nr:BlaI/MecI/CopY family transcriptional regulator [Verrucomicrobiales bacterium]MCP5527719.1 BlaI/MecI/CopY family transcriptional regulator [Verrucomicrobiales bacterium]
MSIPDISESEWAVMEALWGSSPQTAHELTHSLNPSMHWAENTVRTLLSRLVERARSRPAQTPRAPALSAPRYRGRLA